MDARVFRMAILTIISAFILVLVIVYATNTDKINSLFGVKDKPQPVASDAATEEVSEEPVIYGDQIGDSLSGFLLDDDFFDETEKIPSVVVIKKSEASTDESSAESSFAEEEDRPGTGMAVVGELTNPNLEGAATDASGYLTSLPPAPDGGYGDYIPSDQTISGTPVGQP